MDPTLLLKQQQSDLVGLVTQNVSSVLQPVQSQQVTM